MPINYQTHSKYHKKSSPAKRPGRGKAGFRRNRKAPKPIKIKPGSDAKLKKIFASIGVPDKSPFKPDSFQVKAVNAVKHADTLVTAPTGSGKTWIAEKAITRTLKDGGKTWYATPLKALTNSIYSNFSNIFGPEQVGILTGDRKENPDAPVIVGTTEILRNHLYDAMHEGTDLPVDLVVLDEAHFLGDPERGVVWEEIMIYLPPRIPLLMLSATIGNANQIASWLSSIREKECVVIEESKRPVSLYPLFFHPSGTLFPLTVQDEKKNKARLYKKTLSYIQSKRPPLLSRGRKLPPMDEIIGVLRKYNLLPALFFLKSRIDCDNAVNLCTEEGLLSDPGRKDHLNKRIEELVSHSPHIKRHRQRWHLEHLAVGSHHSGQLPAWKIVVENLMAEGLLDAVFATSTVAAGVNFPARSVVILNSDRFNGADFMPLTSTEFHQMTGRAGRRGMDKVGFAVTLPGKFMDLRLIAKLINSPASDVHSQIRINFSMVLNLLLSHTPDQIKELLDKSFASFLLAKKRRNAVVPGFINDVSGQLWKDFQRRLNFLKEHDYVSKDDTLTDDGIWASKLRIDQPLMVAEGFRLGIFPETDPALLAAIMSSFVNERETDDDKISKDLIPKKLVSSFLHIKKMLRPFAKNMFTQGFSVNPICLEPAVTIFSWAADMPWEKVVQNSGLAEGDLARLILRTSDNLRHIRNLSHIFPEAAETSKKSIDLLNKEPVVSFYS